MRRAFGPLSTCFALALSLACASQKSATEAPAQTAPPAPAAPPPAATRPPQFLPTTVYSGGDGTSVENAVVVMADTEEEGVRRENEWIFGRYGKFRKTGVGLATVAQKKIDVIRVELADHSEKEIFFDITSFFGKSEGK